MTISLTAYEQLTPDEQLFASANLERVERGLPAITVLTKSLAKVAQTGAADDADPPLDQVPDQLPGGGRDRDGRGPRGQGQGHGDSETDLFAGVCGPAPTDVVITWAEAEKLLHIT
jgi:hypothetical protein